MRPIHLPAGAPEARLAQARQLFFEQGEAPDGLLDPLILRSWERCRRFGLHQDSPQRGLDALDRVALKTEQDRHRQLLQVGRPIMAHVFEQIRDTGSMVILADANGLVLDTEGDPDFLAKADRVALLAGASWDENQRGTNAIGTALLEEAPVAVLGSEHFLLPNTFLTCCACPIFGADGQLLGILDISGDYRNHQRHTLGLVRLSAALIERRLFETRHGSDLLLAFHPSADSLGTPAEGLAALGQDGQILAINRRGAALLGLRPLEAIGRDFSYVFENSLATLVDRSRHHLLAGSQEIHVGGRSVQVQLRGRLPAPSSAGRVFEEAPAVRRAPPRDLARSSPRLTLDALGSGDPRLQAAIERARRIVGRDIPMLIQGESGVGKEMFAKAFHQSGPRRDAPFVALNCASIPETLIESELFGYQGGAFTGARREGAPGKILQADGGTLFLDEIGDMPLNLQARLLRVLQERSVTPLGSIRSVNVDLSLICATHRNLREEVARGNFREDLYYRLHGLAVTLPPLRERSDIRTLVERMAEGESAAAGRPICFSESALRAIEAYRWPGNIRQLFNVVRVAIALLDAHETEVLPEHLPEELLEVSPLPEETALPAMAARMGAVSQERTLHAIGREAVEQALAACGGNLSEAARRLGVSRNTLYRKLGKH